LGFYPEVIHKDYPYFNLQDGKFEKSPLGDYAISGKNLELLKQLLGIKFDALNEVKLNAQQRQSFLNLILLYYKLHLGGFKEPKSLQILNQVFN
jgi:DNA repair protein RecO (recombination protein O)